MNNINRNTFLRAVDHVITPVIIDDESVDISRLHFNIAFYNEVGYNIDDIPNHTTWWRTVYPDPAYREEIQTAWNNKKTTAKANGNHHFSLAARIYCADNSYKWYEFHSVAVGSLKMITLLNISRIKEKNDKLVNVIQQKTLLLSVLTHEVRSPLSNLKAILDGYQMNYLNKSRICEIALALTDQLSYLLNTVAPARLRMESQREVFIFKPEEIKLKDFLNNCRHVFNRILNDLQINLVFEIPGPGIIYYDQFALDIIFRNVIDHAIMHTPKNGVIKISLRHYEKHSSLIITNPGNRMTAEQMDAMENQNHHQSAGQDIAEGFSLGLISAKQILEQYRGKLSVSNSLATGASCEIMIYN
ncbi:Histidine kinase-, DNA gyrase B-, and HSP90-like ATPase [Mucilaginibacter gossypiicola]|uniref:histidine kinase n=1 Tax=Mucilaginibacter gossypiicola TaxID=551995 RepID=A0A1H8LD54_9SPHI|nr:HAMP domain-containing sensor histidine kinase [Mucilaginibacter gossypiicola]SEO03094.1 Histidine kinase-, DNA gyrase B-, and HSP90-like ATPase [Mucilaginibacter gossypiicola]